MEKIIVILFIVLGAIYEHFWGREIEMRLYYENEVKKFKNLIETSVTIEKDELFQTIMDGKLIELTGLSDGYYITEKVKAKAEQLDLYWIFDIIAAYQELTLMQNYSCQVWSIYTQNVRTFIQCTDLDGNVLQKHFIRNIEFPNGVLEIILLNCIIVLPSEC